MLRSFLVFTGFVSREAKFLVNAYRTYVRPLLEYNSFIWSPCDVGSIVKLENVQRRFTKRFRCVSHLSYKDRLAALCLETLEYRRLVFDLVMMYKIAHHLIDIDCDSFITVNNTLTRNSYLKLFKPRCRSSIRANFLPVKCINVWNVLPEAVRASSSIHVFKRNLSSINLTLYLKIYKF